MTRRRSEYDLDDLHEYGVLLRSRTIFVDPVYENGDDEDKKDDVSKLSTMKFIKNLTYLESISTDPVKIILNSSGGCIYQGMAMYDAIRASDCHVTIEVYGEACSMGLVILQAAERRLIHKHATVMFHLGGGATRGDVNPYEAASGAIFDLKYSEQIDQILLDAIRAKHPDFSRAKFREYNTKGRYWTAQEAVELGLADEVIDKDAG